MSYSSQLLDHFEHPRNVGDLPNADAHARVEHPVCGDIMTLAIKISEGRVHEVRYRTRGCVASIAAGSCLTEMIKDKPLAEIAALQREQLVQELGGLTNASMHASHLALDTLARVLQQLKEKPL